MFRGENNRMLDSFLFRVTLTVAGLLTWSGLTYMLLSV